MCSAGSGRTVFSVQCGARKKNDTNRLEVPRTLAVRDRDLGGGLPVLVLDRVVGACGLQALPDSLVAEARRVVQGRVARVVRGAYMHYYRYVPREGEEAAFIGRVASGAPRGLQLLRARGRRAVHKAAGENCVPESCDEPRGRKFTASGARCDEVK